MGRFEQRIQRLEGRMGVKRAPGAILITPQLDTDDDEESPFHIRLSAELWAHVCAPLTDDEIRALKDEFREDE